MALAQERRIDMKLSKFVVMPEKKELREGEDDYANYNNGLKDGYNQALTELSPQLEKEIGLNPNKTAKIIAKSDRDYALTSESQPEDYAKFIADALIKEQDGIIEVKEKT